MVLRVESGLLEHCLSGTSPMGESGCSAPFGCCVQIPSGPFPELGVDSDATTGSALGEGMRFCGNDCTLRSIFRAQPGSGRRQGGRPGLAPVTLQPVSLLC